MTPVEGSRHAAPAHGLPGTRTKTSPAPKDRSNSADRTLEILGLFDDDHPVLTAREVSQRLQMSRSTTYRYLQSLKTSGFIDDGLPESGFGLGPRIHELARIARRTFGLSQVLLPVMNDIAERLGETVLFSRLVGGHVVCLERVEGSHPIRMSYERGQVLPVNAGAAAKVLLAGMTDSEVDDLLAAEPLRSLTPSAPTDPVLFKLDLERIRRDGYAVSRGEVDDGVIGIAAPVYDAAGSVIGGLGVAALEFRTTTSRAGMLIAAVTEAAEHISGTLRLISE